MHNKIVTHLWFDKEAKEASEFYVSLFDNSNLTNVSTISDTPSGDVDIVTFQISGRSFMAISAGPMFKFNQSISMFAYCGSEKRIDFLFEKLSEKGEVLMPLGKYDWSSKYAWVKDKYGLSWQLDIDDINSSQKIVPALLFVNERFSRIKEAENFYNSVFHDSKIIMEVPYDKSANQPEDALLFAQFSLSGNIFNAMSSYIHHDFEFNEAVSFIVYCDTQEEIDYYWDKLTDEGQEQPCGWLKDKFGVSWQIVPKEMDGMLSTKNKEQLDRVTKAMLKMIKLDVASLKRAYDGK